MKKMILLLAAIVIIAVGIFIYALMNVQSLFASQQPRIERQLTEQLGTPVALGTVGLSLFPTTEISITGTKLGNDGAGADALTVGDLTLRASLMSLLAGKLVVDELCIANTDVHAVQTAEGLVISGLPLSKAKELTSERPHQSAKQSTQSSQAAPAPEAPAMKVELSHICVKNASLTIRDEGKGTTTTVTKIHLQSAIDIASGKIFLPSFEAGATVSGLGPITAMAKDMSYTFLTQQVEIPSASIAALGNTLNLRAGYSLQSQSGNLFVDPSTIGVNGEEVTLTLEASLTPDTASMKQLAIKLFGGALDGNGTIALKQPQQGNLQIAISHITLDALSRALLQDSKIKLSGDLEKVLFDGRIQLAPAGDLSPLATLDGKSELLFRDGEIQGMSLGRMILESVADLPFLGASLFATLPEAQRQKLHADSTAIQTLSGSFTIASGILSTSNLALQSDLFALHSSGSVDLPHQSLDLAATATFAPEVSSALVAKVHELKGLLDDKGQLNIPVQLTGLATAPTVLPNVQEIMKLTVGKRIEDTAGKLLDRALGGKKSGGTNGKKPGLGDLLGF